MMLTKLDAVEPGTAGLSVRVITGIHTLPPVVRRIARTDLRPATSVSERGASGSVSSEK